ncbi:DinB family protein [Arthrobacter yangruifuii]|uniref:DinB family protein n=1 Tax=Arthrobacter yangruifuii TaxID=2606616 RepID=UPI0011B3C6D7|nr:DinB family protein [Arthrobacter yangruifuii]
MTENEPPQRIQPPLAGSEIETLLGSLDRQRATFAWKTGGLDAEALTATVGASAITLGGLLKHLAGVEDTYFAWRLRSQDPGEPWNAVDWANDPGWDWRTAADDRPEDLYALWSDAVGRSRRRLAAALDDGGLDQLLPAVDGQVGSLRRMLVDLIEEYARHTGHADLIRESVDGLVGEDPPADVSWPAPTAGAAAYPAPAAGA